MSKKIEIKKHLMTAISFFLPIVVASGFLLAIGNMMGGWGWIPWWLGRGLPCGLYRGYNCKKS